MEAVMGVEDKGKYFNRVALSIIRVLDIIFVTKLHRLEQNLIIKINLLCVACH